MWLSNQVGWGLWRSNLALSMGERVSATKPETRTAPASARANSLNSLPVRPGVKASGANTAVRVRVMATTANPISRTPLIAAENGSIPSSMWRYMFSSTTMASSTTSPMASTSASRVRVLMVKPASAIMAKVPIRLTGMVMMGMIEALRVLRNTNITSATSTTASTMVLKTLLMDRSMNTELSLAMCTVTLSGRSACRRGSMSLTPLDSSRGLAVACRITPAEIEGTPLSRTLLRSSAVPSWTRATSRILTGKPLTVRITMSANWPGRVRSVWAVTLNSRLADSIRPAGNSRLLRRMASSTSCGVSR